MTAMPHVQLEIAAANVRPVIFVDMDGVIVTRAAAGWSRRGSTGAPRSSRTNGARRRSPRSLDPGAIKPLNEICQQSGAWVVVSSSWRERMDVRDVLTRYGFVGAFHTDWKTDSEGPTRSEEIDRWLAGHGAPPYLILDDWPQFAIHHYRAWLRIDSHCGLHWGHVPHALTILESHRRGRVQEGLRP